MQQITIKKDALLQVAEKVGQAAEAVRGLWQNNQNGADTPELRQLFNSLDDGERLLLKKARAL